MNPCYMSSLSYNQCVPKVRSYKDYWSAASNHTDTQSIIRSYNLFLFCHKYQNFNIFQHETQWRKRNHQL